jgi:hypothetical protein
MTQGLVYNLRYMLQYKERDPHKKQIVDKYRLSSMDTYRKDYTVHNNKKYEH